VGRGTPEKLDKNVEICFNVNMLYNTYTEIPMTGRKRGAGTGMGGIFTDFFHGTTVAGEKFSGGGWIDRTVIRRRSSERKRPKKR
jgi:hypothetical protein